VNDKSLKWATANIDKALPCPFCGERLVVKDDHHGAWMGHRNESSNCFESVGQIFNNDDLAGWNTRAAVNIILEEAAKAYEAEADTWKAWGKAGAAKRKGAAAIRALKTLT
jgi:hypothetical protein